LAVSMIIDRYLLREILGPFAVMLTVLCVLFMSFGAAGFLSDAVNGLLPTSMIVQVIGLRTLIALEMLIPISLYLSVVMALGRLYVDSEMTALFALGWPSARLLVIVFGLSLCTAVIVAGLSLVARPWAYTRSHALASVAEASLNSNNMQAGTFYVTGKGERTIYIERREGPAAPAGGVFVQLRLRGGGIRIIHAGSIEELPPVLGAPRFHLSGLTSMTWTSMAAPARSSSTRMTSILIWSARPPIRLTIAPSLPARPASNPPMPRPTSRSSNGASPRR
jgi:lipopolysaccharide export LptBFGC system permease protein LptF